MLGLVNVLSTEYYECTIPSPITTGTCFELGLVFCTPNDLNFITERPFVVAIVQACLGGGTASRNWTGNCCFALWIEPILLHNGWTGSTCVIHESVDVS